LFSETNDFGVHAELVWGAVMRKDASLAEMKTVVTIDDLADLAEIANLRAAVDGLPPKGAQG
jgi:hypothetical protein